MKSLIIIIPEFRSNVPFAEGIKDIANKYNLKSEFVTIEKNFKPLQQKEFLCRVHVSDIVVVGCTIPSDVNDGGVYPALTAQVNILNHVIVVSENNLPLNITPLRGVFPQKDGERYTIEHILKELPKYIEQSLKEDTYSRIPEDMINDFLKYQKEMEEMLGASLEIRRRNKYEKTSVMISYRNSHSEEVEKFKSIITGTDIQSKKERHRLGCDGDYELKVLPPASLCGADEAHTPMRRWMLVGLLEDHIREVDEVWVYESRNPKGEIDYTKSWWTIAEMIMVANINYDNTKKIKVKVYNPIKQQFYETTPQQYLVNITETQHKRLARYLSNTRPDTMGPECLAQVKQLKMIANLMRHSTEDMKQQMLENLRANFELSVPKTLEEDERKQMIDDMIKMYSDPDEIERYANDDVFQEKFWNDISYQTAEATDCFTNNRIDVDKFMSTPMDEVTGHPLEDFVKASLENEGIINLGTSENPLKYKVSKANIDRYLWLATRMGRPTVKDGNAPGLERISIYNITKYE